MAEVDKSGIQNILLKAVRLYVEIKSVQKCLQKLPKKYLTSVLLRSNVIYISPKSNRSVWLPFVDNLSPRRLKIVQSGHTD